MVCVTIILAAIVAAFVFGMAGDQKGSHIVNIKVTKHTTSEIVIMNEGGQDVGDLTSVSITAYQDDGTTKTGTLGLTVGSETDITGTFTELGGNRILVVGKFADNTEQILVDVMV